MRLRRLSPSSLLLLSLHLAACGSSDGDSGSTGGAAGTSAGGAAGAAGAAGGASGQGGTSGSSGQSGAAGSSAGAAGSSAGGSAGSAAGGASGAAGGQAGGAAGGGAAGSSAGGSAGSAAGGASGSAGQGAGGTKAATLISANIDPPEATLVVLNGAVTTQSFQVIGTYDDNSVKVIDAQWSFDKPDLALVTPGSGVVTPSGEKGGQGVLTAVAEGQTLTASVTVKLVFSENPGNLTPEQRGQLDAGGGPDGGGKILYPYDQTVFARGLLTPELMWSGGQPGDGYLVRVTADNFEASYYTLAEPPSRAQLPQKTWDVLTGSNHGESVQVEVRRLSGGVVYAPMKQSWKVAQGSLRGSIYYWAVNVGELLKIAPGASQPVPVFDAGMASDLGSPAPANYDGTVPPWSAGSSSGKRCVACHTVSRDGSTLAGLLERKGQTPSPWMSVDLLANPAQVTQVSPYESQAIFVALSPDAKFATHNDVNLTLRLADGKTGAPIASPLDAFADKVADPAFSPDGKLFAFSGNVTGSYPVEFWRADLDVMDFDPVTGALGNRRMIASGGDKAIAFPSFTPDSASVVYQKGDYSRAKYGNNQHGVDDLYLTSVAPGLGEIPLDLANGVGHVEERNLHLNYQPTVNPIAVGGYYWVVFVSPRDYGNKMLSTTDPTYQNRKQLWVAAIDANPQPGKDPSHPAFLLRGQDETTTNMSGYWSLEACKQEGNSCSEGFECCTGFCRLDGNNQPVCVAPPANSCSTVGEKCVTSADCCSTGEDLACTGGFCALAKP